MSDTHRKHAPLGELRRSGGMRKARSATEALRREQAGIVGKSHKQRRPNERAALRKEWT